MARRLQDNSGTVAPGGSYPYGRAKDNTGSGDGTPVNEQFIGDITQFFERLMALTSTVANMLPENSTNGFQFITALAAYIVSLSVARSGSSMTGNLAMGGNKVTGLAAASANGEAVRYEELQSEISTRSAADTTLTNNKVAKSGDTMSGNLAMGNNKVTGLAAATANGQAVRYDEFLASSAGLLRAIINIGDWNMNATGGGGGLSVNVAHGLGANYKKIRSVSVIIRDDADSVYRVLTRGGSTTGPQIEGWVSDIDSTNINIACRDGGLFDSNFYDSTSFNRGWVTIEYTP